MENIKASFKAKPYTSNKSNVVVIPKDLFECKVLQPGKKYIFSITEVDVGCGFLFPDPWLLIEAIV